MVSTVYTNFQQPAIQAEWLNDVNSFVYGSGFVQSGINAVPNTITNKLRERISVLDFIPLALHANILAGGTAVDLSSYIQSWLNRIDDGICLGVWPGGVYGHNLKLDISGNANILFEGKVTLQALAIMDYQIKHASELSLFGTGEFLFDGDLKVTYANLHSTNRLPKLQNIRLLDSGFGWNTGSSVSTHLYGVTGNGIFENVTAENCSNVGFTARGDLTPVSRTATLLMKNCKTVGTTGSGNYDGSGVGYLLHISGMASVYWDGGDFTGSATALVTNAYECSEAQVIGGYYHNIARGPTMGRNTQNFVIANTVSASITGNAVNADTTDGVGDTVGVGRISGNVIRQAGRAVRTTCSYVDVTDNFAYECTDLAGAFAFAGTGAEVWVDGNHEYKASATGVAFVVTETTIVRYGTNYTNSTQRNNYFDSVGSSSVRGATRTITANDDLRGSDHEGIIYMDCTAGSVDLDLFSTAEVRQTGFEFTLIKIDNSANLGTLTFQGGGGGETINGLGFLQVEAGDRYRAMRFYCKDGPTGTWICDGLPVVGAISTTPIGNIGAGQDNLISYSMAAGSLYRANKGVRIVQSGIAANNANAKILTTQVGGIDLFSQALAISVAGEWLVEYDLVSTGVDTQYYTGRLVYESSASVWTTIVFKGTLALDDGATIVIRCTGSATTTNDIVQEYQRVSYLTES